MKRRIAKKLLITQRKAYWRWLYGCVGWPFPREDRIPMRIIIRDALKGKLRWVPPHMRELWKPASPGLMALAVHVAKGKGK